MPDNITFAGIPTDRLVPGAYIEFDPSMADQGLPSERRRILMLGQRLTSGTVAANVPTRIFGDGTADAPAYFGRGSQIADAIKMAKSINRTTEMWAMAQDDLQAGVAAHGTFPFTGPATEAGIVYAYVNGTRIPVGVAAGDTATVIATDVAAAINALPDLPVTATAATGTVTVTCRHKGLWGNDIDLRLNYYDGETLPAGVGCVITPMTAGAGNPDVTDAFAAFGDKQFTTLIGPYTDTPNIVVIEAQLTTLWGPLIQKTAHYFALVTGTLSAMTTYGDGRNSPQDSFFGISKIPQAPYLYAAAAGAAAEYSAGNDPAAPVQRIPLPGLMPPAPADRIGDDDRNLLLKAGISTFIIQPDGTVEIERVVTTYKENVANTPDIAWRDIETKWTADYVRFTFVNRVLLEYPNHKLCDDDTPIPAGQKMVNPKTLKSFLTAVARELQAAGEIQDVDGSFIDGLIALLSATDPGRVNAILTPKLVGQFRVLAAALQYRLL